MSFNYSYIRCDDANKMKQTIPTIIEREMIKLKHSPTYNL